MKNNDLRESIACVADVILTSVSNVGGAASRSSFCAPNGLNEITRSEFRIFFHADWQIDNGVFNWPIMALLKSWYRRWGPKQAFRRPFADRLSEVLWLFFRQKLSSSFVHSTSRPRRVRMWRHQSSLSEDSRYRVWFQTSSSHLDSANWPGPWGRSYRAIR